MSASRFQQFNVQHYAREVRQHLPAEVFEPATSRLLWLPLHLAVIGAMAAYVVAAAPAWYVAFACAAVAGHSWTCLGFLAHETLHHAVVRSRTVERLVGYCGLLIYCLSPTLWVAWHNQAHHGNTASPGVDPDTLGTLDSWRDNVVDREYEKIAPGSGYLRSIIFPFVTFSIHSLVVLFVHSQRHDYYARISRRVVYTETAAMFAFWLAVLLLAGPWNFVFLYVVPALFANFFAISYIATNHFLNSLTSVNDPLANSLSVTNLSWVEKLHLQFGYHVEHHILPTVSGRHAPAVREVLVRLYGERYLTLPHARALHLLYTRPKLHDGADALVDPRTMTRYATLAPGALAMAAGAQAAELEAAAAGSVALDS